jgi:hypothetical protein
MKSSKTSVDATTKSSFVITASYVARLPYRHRGTAATNYIMKNITLERCNLGK